MVVPPRVLSLCECLACRHYNTCKYILSYYLGIRIGRSGEGWPSPFGSCRYFEACSPEEGKEES